MDGIAVEVRELTCNFFPHLIMDVIANVKIDIFPWSQISMAIANQAAWQYHCPPWLCRITFRWKKMVDKLLDGTFKGVLSVIMSLISMELLMWPICNNVHAHVLPQLFGKFGESAFNLYWLIMSIYAGLNEHEVVSHDGPFAIPFYSMLY